jgi:hypothetical protein
MKTEYQDWIDNYIKHNKVTGECFSVTIKMQATFPELVRVRGHYYCPWWGERAHWWLKDGAEIIDPTAFQFPSGGRGAYIEWDESQPEPTGICANCGDHCYDGRFCCGEPCEMEFMGSLDYPY